MKTSNFRIIARMEYINGIHQKKRVITNYKYFSQIIIYSMISPKSPLSLDELIRYVISVDRRLLAIKELQTATIFRASDIAEKVGRSLQNVSRALKELEMQEIIVCINPQSQTWKKYMLTEKGKQVLNALKNKKLI